MNSEEERTENMSGGLGKDQGIFPLGNIVQRGWNGFSSFLGTLREPENINFGYGRSDKHAPAGVKDEVCPLPLLSGKSFISKFFFPGSFPVLSQKVLFKCECFGHCILQLKSYFNE